MRQRLVIRLHMLLAFENELVYRLVRAAVDQIEVSYGLMLLGIKSTHLARRHTAWCECVCVTILNFSE